MSNKCLEQNLTGCFCMLFCKVLKLDLKEIREQQDLLFRFMSFLKEEGAVHVLQFCLTVGEDMHFNAHNA